MSWPLVQIGKYADKVRTWNPAAGAECVFQYVDLSSVDKSRKIIDLDNVAEISSAEAPSRARQLVVAGDVLVATVRPNLNGVAVVPAELNGATASTGYCVLRADEKNLHGRYLFHWVQTGSFVEDMMSKATGANYPAVSDKIVKESKIPLPPLPEQKRIAAILDKADAIRRKRQQAIQLADDFLRAVFLDMFGDPVTNPKGWEEHVLKEIADIRSGVTKGKAVKPEDSVTRPYMRVANVQDGYLDLADVQQITVSKRDAEKCLLLEGDILLTEGGDPDKLGRGHVWRSEVEGCLHQNHIFSVRVNDRECVRPAFLSAIISSPRGKRYFLKVGKQTTGIATINKSVLSEFVPFVPPVVLQDKYLAVAKRVDAVKQSLAEGDFELFNSLSHKAFAAQL